MLEKRDRGRDADVAAAPLPFGARRLAERIPGAELLEAELRGDVDGGASCVPFAFHTLQARHKSLLTWGKSSTRLKWW